MLDEARLGKVQLTSAGWFDLVLEATGDREQAERVRNEHIKAQMRAGQTPQ